MAYEIEVVERERQPVACVRETVPDGEIGDLVGRLIMEVLGELQGAGVVPSGPPYARSAWQPGTDVEVGFPVAEPVAGGFEAVRAWVAEQGLQPAGVPREVYHSDPREVPDPKYWRTDLVLPVQ